MSQPPDDPALIERARRDPEASAALYRRYLTPVYHYLYRRLANVNDAEDLTAQVFTEALEGLRANRYRAVGYFPAWLFNIADSPQEDGINRQTITRAGIFARPNPVICYNKSSDICTLASG